MADVIKYFEQKIAGIPGVILKTERGGWRMSIRSEATDPKIIMKELRSIQIQLRAIKREVDINLKHVRSSFTETIANSTYKPGLGGILLGSRYRGAATKAAAQHKRDLTTKKKDAVRPYEQVKAAITNFIDQIEREKIQLEVKSKQ
ncbi:MAG: hypothetical protein ACYCZF_09165 [Anaerolineae bacterium]